MTNLFVFDDLHPEDNAMAQAMYSRDPKSVRLHLKKGEFTLLQSQTIERHLEDS